MHRIYCKDVRINPTTIYSVLDITSHLQPAAVQLQTPSTHRLAGNAGTCCFTTAGWPQLADHWLFNIAAGHFTTQNSSIIANCFFFPFLIYDLVLSTHKSIKTSTRNTTPGLCANLVHIHLIDYVTLNSTIKRRYCRVSTEATNTVTV